MKTKHVWYIMAGLVILIFTTLYLGVVLGDKNNSQSERYIFEESQKNEEIVSNNRGDELMEMDDKDLIIEEPIQEGDVLDFADVDPEFPGGEAEMAKFIQRNVIYPEYAKEMGEQGTVYVRFVVNTDGSIQNVEVSKGVSESLDREAVRVIKKMPQWTPGRQNGERVRVRFMVPIKFSIA